jgi:hypothetical protein
MTRRLNQRVLFLEKFIQTKKPRLMPRMVIVQVGMSQKERAEAVELFAYNKSLSEEFSKDRSWLTTVIPVKGRGEEYFSFYELATKQIDELVAEIESEAEQLLQESKNKFKNKNGDKNDSIPG